MVKLIIMEGERKCVCVRERGERDTHTEEECRWHCNKRERP